MAEFQSISGRGGGSAVSPGGFEFGVQGWHWGEPRPKSITFFTDGTAMVSDQHGRPIRGVMDATTGKELRFVMTAPMADRTGAVAERPGFATHAQVIEALAAERIEWTTLSRAGWPQIPYDELHKVKETLPPTPISELKKIKDQKMKEDALKMRREIEEEAKEE